MKKSVFEPVSDILIDWYRDNKRDLPIRETRNPYHIWLSEVILQQTRMEQGLPYYEAFVRTFPDVHSLASATEETVLRYWQGLGYYSRARNLHACAKIISETFGGTFPRSASELQKLPGIGPYTAAAIASFSFDEAVPTIDGNALRLFTRLFAVKDDIRKAVTIRKIAGIAQQIIPHDSPGPFNHAVMDFGSLVCKPAPDCLHCPLTHLCEAYQQKRTDEIPYKSKAAAQKKRYFHYFVLQQQDCLAMRKRSSRDIWKNLYEFHLIEGSRLSSPDEIADPLVRRLSGSEMDVLGDVKHILSHQVIHARFIRIKADNQPLPEGLHYYTPAEVDALPKPVMISKFLAEHFNSSKQNDNFKN